MVAPTIYSINKLGCCAKSSNYRMIMVGHTFSKLYATILHMKLSRELERRLLRSRGQARFHSTHQTIDHILTLRAIIEEERHFSLKVYFGLRLFSLLFHLCTTFIVSSTQRRVEIGTCTWPIGHQGPFPYLVLMVVLYVGF